MIGKRESPSWRTGGVVWCLSKTDPVATICRILGPSACCTGSSIAFECIPSACIVKRVLHMRLRAVVAADTSCRE